MMDSKKPTLDARQASTDPPLNKLQAAQSNLESQWHSKQKHEDMTQGHEDMIQGLTFKLDDSDQSYVLSSPFLAEVIAVPQVTRVPLVKSWFLGLHALRGRLLTVNDLRSYLFGQLTQIDHNSRVLIFDYTQFLFGFIIRSTSGFGHFLLDDVLDEKIITSQPWVSPICLNEVRPHPANKAPAVSDSEKYFLLNIERILNALDFHRIGQDS